MKVERTYDTGYHHALYNFEDDTVGGNPTGWNITEPANTTVEIIASLGGHNKVLKLADASVANWCRAENTFSDKTAGTVELYVRMLQTDKSGEIIIGDGDNTHCIYFSPYSTAKFRYYDGNWHDICSYSANTWYHLRFYFLIGTGWCVWIDHVRYPNSGYYSFRGTPTAMDRFWVVTNAPDELTIYVDAVDYSWATDYEINRNTTTLTTEEVAGAKNIEIERNLDMVARASFTLHNPHGTLNDTWLDRHFESIVVRNTLGYYYGAYGFQYDTVGNAPADWSEVGAGTSTITSEYNGRKKVLVQTGVSTIYRSFDAQSNGTVEVSVCPTSGTDWYLRLEGNACGIRLHNGNIYYKSAVETDTGVDYENGVWLHLKLAFECGADEYDGLAADTFHIYYRTEDETVWKRLGAFSSQAADDLEEIYLTHDAAGESTYVSNVDVSWADGYVEGRSYDPIPLFQGRIKNVKAKAHALLIECEGLGATLKDAELEDESFTLATAEIEAVTDGENLECCVIDDVGTSPEWTADQWIGKGLTIEDKTSAGDVLASEQADADDVTDENENPKGIDTDDGDYSDTWANDADYWETANKITHAGVTNSAYYAELEFQTINLGAAPVSIEITYKIYAPKKYQWMDKPTIEAYNYDTPAWDTVVASTDFATTSYGVYSASITVDPDHYLSNGGAGNDTFKMRVYSGYSTDVVGAKDYSRLHIYYLKVEVWEDLECVPRTYVITDNTDDDLTQTAENFVNDHVSEGDYVHIIERNDIIIASLAVGFENTVIKTSSNYSGMDCYGLTPLHITQKLAMIDIFRFWVDLFGAFRYTDAFDDMTHALTDSDVIQSDQVEISYSSDEFCNAAKVYGYNNIESDWQTDTTSVSTYGVVKSKVIKDDTITTKVEANALALSIVNQKKDIEPSCVIKVRNLPFIDLGHTITLTLQHLSATDFTVEGISYRRAVGKETSLLMTIRLGNQPVNLPPEERLALYIKSLYKQLKTIELGLMQ